MGWMARNTYNPSIIDPVVRMNRHGIQSGIFQCLLERGPSDYVANEVSDLANEGNITGTIKCPVAAAPVVGNLRFRKDVELGTREVPAILIRRIWLDREVE